METPKFYELRKVRKKDYPLKPMVSDIGSISHYTARHLADILRLLVGNTPHHVKNSADFASKFPDLTVTLGQKLVSYDVSTPFTSFLVAEAISCVKHKSETLSNWKEKTIGGHLCPEMHAKNRQRAGDFQKCTQWRNLNEVIRGAPYKVERLT